ncbi:MAG: WbqC family protein [Bacteroidia bacterium]
MQDNMKAALPLFPCVYFGPVQWYAHAVRQPQITLDIHEHYLKQTWRNRIRIAGANGIQDLIIPVSTSGNHTPMQDIRIDASKSWQKHHWQSIQSAYGKSPFFEFYADQIAALYQKDFEKLTDFNIAGIQLMLKLLKIKTTTAETNSFVPYNDIQDLRLLISPKSKIQDAAFIPQRYIQVFEERHGFQPNLCILDLLFCTGPMAANYFTVQL